MSWMPISEAPKDGTVIDVVHRTGVIIFDVYYEDEGWSCKLDDYSLTLFRYITTQ